MEQVTISLERYDQMKSDISFTNDLNAQLTYELERETKQNETLVKDNVELNNKIKDLIKACIKTDYSLYDEIETFNLDTNKLCEYLNNNYKEDFTKLFKEIKEEENELN